jgi:hypothetical protein
MNLLLSGEQKNIFSLVTEVQSSIEEVTYKRFERFLGHSVEEISKSVGYFKSGPNHKAFLHDLSKRILGGGTHVVSELEKADIELKTIRLTTIGRPRESMSFPAFNLQQIPVQDWEDSSFFENVSGKCCSPVFGMFLQ